MRTARHAAPWLVFLCVAAEPIQVPKPTDDAYDSQVDNSLLVQSAMQQGRAYVLQRDYRAAIRVLEAQLPKINGNKAYLKLLEEVYRGYVKELQLAGETNEARKYLERLAILAPEAPPAPAKTEPKTEPAKEPTPAPPINGPEALKQAELAFNAKKYADAAKHYDLAIRGGQALTSIAKERWAYCRLFSVAQQINEEKQVPNWLVLEQEVRQALSLAPESTKLRFGQGLLQTIQAQQTAQPREAKYGQLDEGWQVSESLHFRVHHQDAAMVKEVLETAERCRAAVIQRWLGADAQPEWLQKCDLYLYPTATDYARATGVPTDSPGHSSISAERYDASRVHSRRIDLRLDEPHLLLSVLPHEITHVTLAGTCGTRVIPRWADEGTAIMAEPEERIQRHVRPLPEAYKIGRVFTAQQLLELADYPPRTMLEVFYGQSVVLVQFLVERKDTQTVVRFLRDAPKVGIESALAKHFDLESLAELDAELKAFTLKKCTSLP